ncbi:hypothetical protein GALL_67550 [mine drainage metagenome]|uniref:Uncharacterized protein n=1 Tax=mine drainage metagenome TaxID=410659 RepID=A0A1J5STQ0_9ZZZZ
MRVWQVVTVHAPFLRSDWKRAQVRLEHHDKNGVFYFLHSVRMNNGYCMQPVLARPDFFAGKDAG